MLVIFILLLIGCLSAFIFIISKKTKTKPFVDSNNKILTNSIAQIEFLTLGGIKQWILMRGKNKDNPILLFLHGGPGVSEHGLLRYYNSDLENDFVVVGWDQRGACKSYSKKIRSDDLRIDYIISDLHELISYLKKKFGKEKVFLLGKSWGSLLGTLYAQKYPGDIMAYIGTGQVADLIQSEQLSLQFTLDEARKRNCKKGIRELESLKNPGKDISDIVIQRKWLVKFGGHLYGKTSYNHWLFNLLKTDEFSLQDFIWLYKGGKLSLKAMWPEVLERSNLFEVVPKLQVPTYFLLGRHDYCTSSKLAADYFDKLQAPLKQLIWFEKSGHNPPFEEPNNFNNVLRNIRNNFINI